MDRKKNKQEEKRIRTHRDLNITNDIKVSKIILYKTFPCNLTTVLLFHKKFTILLIILTVKLLFFYVPNTWMIAL